MRAQQEPGAGPGGPRKEESALDFSLYYITPEKNSGERSDREVVEAAIAGGATVIQLRKKEMTTRRLLELGQALRELTRRRGVP